MVTEVRIYAEGGGNDKSVRRNLRAGLSQFLDPLRQLARARQIHWNVILSGSRNETYANFALALKTHPDAFNVLLVDSESPVRQAPWEHLRSQDGWDRRGCSEEQCHLMVQAIEAWLIADPETLVGFYGQGFLLKALPDRNDVEAVPKDKVLAALSQATEKTQKKKYHKTRHCPDLLARLNPEQVRWRARHCDRLFTSLEEILRA